MDPANVAHHVLQQLEHAWNRADGAAYGAEFTDDAEFVDIRGILHRGRPAIAGGHQAIFNSIYKGSTMSYRLVGARAVSPEVVVCHGVATMKTPNGMFDGRHALNTLVLARSGEQWRVTAFHNQLADVDSPAP
jgi:uncharacterized protein (TIGR02246 family)